MRNYLRNHLPTSAREYHKILLNSTGHHIISYCNFVPSTRTQSNKQVVGLGAANLMMAMIGWYFLLKTFHWLVYRICLCITECSKHSSSLSVRSMSACQSTTARLLSSMLIVEPEIYMSFWLNLEWIKSHIFASTGQILTKFISKCSSWPADIISTESLIKISELKVFLTGEQWVPHQLLS